jgi:hypothetical protein
MRGRQLFLRGPLVLLCGKHHRLLHRGTLIIEGSISTGLRFYHADGSRYGTAAPDPHAIEAAERAFTALRGLGFKDGETKRALQEVRAHVGVMPSVETLVRSALRVLTA